MTWHAKLTGGYTEGGTESKDNAKAFYKVVKSYGFSLTATSAILGNMQHESGLNPWRWQSDEVSLTSDSKGYGLVQLTPAYGYIYNYGTDLPGFAPSLSVTEITGNVSDANAQSICIATDKAGKYSIRSWAPEAFKLTFDEFKASDNLYNATGAWLYNYESPASVSSLLPDRYASAQVYYEILSGYTPGGNIPLWLLKKLYDQNFML